MAYVHDKSTMGKKVDLDKAFEITKDDKKRAVAVDYTIDTNKRAKTDKVNDAEPRFTK
jgi:hypothetical protein